MESWWEQHSVAARLVSTVKFHSCLWRINRAEELVRVIEGKSFVFLLTAVSNSSRFDSLCLS
jgi:hypothetical protein